MEREHKPETILYKIRLNNIKTKISRRVKKNTQPEIESSKVSDLSTTTVEPGKLLKRKLS